MPRRAEQHAVFPACRLSLARVSCAPVGQRLCARKHPCAHEIIGLGAGDVALAVIGSLLFIPVSFACCAGCMWQLGVLE